MIHHPKSLQPRDKQSVPLQTQSHPKSIATALKHALENTKSLLFLGGAYIITISLTLSAFNAQSLKIVFFDPFMAVSYCIFSIAFLCIQKMRRRLDAYATQENLFTSILFIAIGAPYASAFASFKQSMILLKPFAYDALFWQWDYLLHFRNNPWTLFDPLYDQPFTIQSIDNLYILWFIVLLSITYWMVLTKDKIVSQTYFISTIFVWSLLGSGLGYILYSAGPCYFNRLGLGTDNSYAALFQKLEAINATNSLWALGNQSRLWEAFVSRHWLPFGGISAMPSVHVAMAVVFALTLTSRNVYLGIVGWLYYIAILVGSVVLGWHYAVDGYVATLLTLLIWKMAGFLARMQLFPASPAAETRDTSQPPKA